MSVTSVWLLEVEEPSRKSKIIVIELVDGFYADKEKVLI